MSVRKQALALGTLLALGFSSFGAQALKLDITATADIKSVVTLDPGTYRIDWIGTAGGGQYDGWTYNTATSGNWRNAVTVEVGGTTFTIDKPVANPYANYASAADAIAAFASGPYAVYTSSTAGTYQPSVLTGTVDVPTFTLAASTRLSFGVPDNLYGDNTQGVSLSITAVPEPATCALVLAGLAVVGGAARRRTAKG